MPSNKPGYQKSYYKIWYANNKDKHKQACSIRREAQVKENQLKIISYLEKNPCVDCGESNIVVLQFDHVRDKKYKEIGRMRSSAWATIEKEIAKCDVRCANCHLKKTAQEQSHYRFLWVCSSMGRAPVF
jgi:hypothetical protein